jgi:hypothetical protein
MSLHELIVCLRVDVPGIENTLDQTPRNGSSKIEILKPANKRAAPFSHNTPKFIQIQAQPQAASDHVRRNVAAAHKQARSDWMPNHPSGECP